MIDQVKAISYDHRVLFFWMLVGASVISLVTYTYMINAIARNVALGQDLEKQVRDLSGELNSLEFTYIDLKNDITLDLAHNYGFKEARTPLYVSRTPVALTFNTLD